MFLFLYSSLLLYLTLHPGCFEVGQICFSCQMVYLVFVWFLFATFVWPFLRLMFPSDVLLIDLSRTYHVLVCCFLSVFQSRFLAFLFLLFQYMLRLVLLFYFFPKVLQSICHFINYYIEFLFLSFPMSVYKHLLA